MTQLRQGGFGSVSRAHKYRYGSAKRRAAINRRLPIGTVVTHHIIPRSLQKHVPDYDVDATYNLMLMPTAKGMLDLNLNPGRFQYAHEGGHPSYNRMMQDLLVLIGSHTPLIFGLVFITRFVLRKGVVGMPWK